MFFKFAQVSRQGIASVVYCFVEALTSSRATRSSHAVSYQVMRMFSSSLPEHVSVTMPALSPVCFVPLDSRIRR